MLYDGYINGNLITTIDPKDSVASCDMIWICVGTPSQFDGGIDLSYIETVVTEIGMELKNTNGV